MRLLWIFLSLAILFTIPFLIWGETMGVTFSTEGAINWLSKFEQWAWAAGITLLLLDFILPIPGTAVMSALGYVYGAILGGAISAMGSILAGLVAYTFCRLLGPKAAKQLLGKNDYHKGITLFANAGGWLVVLSRWMPLLPEVVACMAGLAQMPFRKFLLALTCGSLPLGFVFAYIGSTGTEYPTLAIAFSAAIPPILWIITRRLIKTEQ